MKIIQLLLSVFYLLFGPFKFLAIKLGELVAGKKELPTTLHKFPHLPDVPMEWIFKHSNPRELLILAIQSTFLKNIIKSTGLGEFSYTIRAEKTQTIEFFLDKMDMRYGEKYSTVFLKRIQGDEIKLWAEMELVRNEFQLEMYLYAPPDLPDTITFYTHSDVRRHFPRFQSYLFSIFPPFYLLTLHLDLHLFPNLQVFTLRGPFSYGFYITLLSPINPIPATYLFTVIFSMRKIVKLMIDGQIDGDIKWIKGIHFENLHFINAHWLRISDLENLNSPVVFASDVNWTNVDVFNLLLLWWDKKLSSKFTVCAIHTSNELESAEGIWDHFQAIPSVHRNRPFEINCLSVPKLPSQVDMSNSMDVSRHVDNQILTVGFWDHGVLLLSWKYPEEPAE